MANNRLWLVCPECKGRILLFKHNGQEWYFWHDVGTDILDTWMAEHQHGVWDGLGPTFYELEYETESKNDSMED